MFFNLTTKTIMKKIILTSLLFSLTTLVNATISTITLTANTISENQIINSVVGAVSGDGSGTTYIVQDAGNTYFQFEVGSQGGNPNSNNNFIVQDTDGNNHTIATVDFLVSGATTNPASVLAAAINTYNAANNSGFSATSDNYNADSGQVTLTAFPATLEGATIVGFNTVGNFAITVTSTNLTITTPTSDFFLIDATILESKVVFNYEEKASYTIVIRATDEDGSYSKDFTIDIINLADSPTDITSDPEPLSIQENNSIGDIIGTFSTVDGNGGNHTYTLTGANNNLFSIDNNGVLTADVVFDYEEQQSYIVTIKTDDGTPFHTYSENFTIGITDDPTDYSLTLSPQIVAEHNAIGTTVGILATTGGTEPYSYTVSNATNPNKTFTFTVGEEDTDGAADNEFIFRTTDGNETDILIENFFYFAQLTDSPNHPANKLVTAINFDNNFHNTGFAATSTVTTTSTGTVTLTDWPDSYDGATLLGFSNKNIDHITISEANGAGLTLPNYLPFSIKDGKLITTAVLDKATRNPYIITINSTDSSSPPVTISRDFTIIVADGPSGTVTEITISKDTITKKATDGATVGLLETNANDTRRVYVLESNTATFSISGDRLTANNPMSLNEGATYDVYVSTLSGDNTIFTQSLTITVTNETAFSLDVDGNGTFTASNDGLVIFKYLLNSNANNLHTTVANNALETRNSTAELKTYLDEAESILDVDGNETLTASNDGLVIFKYLLNSNANNLHTTISNNALDNRNSTSELKAYLDLYSE